MSWFYAKHGKQEGPVEEEALRAKLANGEVSPEDLVWKEGMAEWTPAGKLAELAPGATPTGAAEPGAGAMVDPGAEGVAGGPPPSSGTAPPGAAMPAQPAAGIPMLATPPPTSGLAIASMVCGIISLLACYVWALVGIPAVICGHMALSSMNKAPYAMEGRGMAIAGVILGYLAILIQIVVVIGIVVWVTRASSGLP